MFVNRHQYKDRQRDREPLFRRHNDVVKLPVGDPPRCFKISSDVYKAVQAEDIQHLLAEVNFDGHLNRENHFNALAKLMLIEEAYQAVNMRKHDKLGAKLQVWLPGLDDLLLQQVYIIELVGQTEGSFVDISDRVLLEDRSTSRIRLERIENIFGDFIALKPNRKLRCDFLDRELNIFFVPTGPSFRACENALQIFAGDKKKQHLIFEHTGISELAPAKVDIQAAGRSDECAELNFEQRQAVAAILRAECRPKPYVLYGPPGTGKTQTLVVAVVQVYLRLPEARILFCANSNTCADQIHARLAESSMIANEDLVRLGAGCFNVSSERIVVTTNIKSNYFTRESPVFDYVFIDEAGHASEPESLVPCCSLKPDGCLVLAGDPKQLGPVVMCDQARDYGLQSSLLDRIMKWKVYQRGDNNKYDSRYLTKLLDSYRCDTRILAISNRRFYDSELRCRNSTPGWLLQVLGLSGGPVQFLACEGGQEFQTEMSTSWMNEVEICQCVNMVIRLYRMGLGPEDIGVISPYKRQAIEMRRRLKLALTWKRPGDGLEMKDHLDARFPAYEELPDWVPRDDLARQAIERNAAKRKVFMETTGMNHVPERIAEIISLEPEDWVEGTTRVRAETEWHKCQIDTVDSFQGNEREVIIFSPVRTNPNRGLQFLKDERRFNVAVSRAKKLLIVVGNETVLSLSELWRELLDSAHQDIKHWPEQSDFRDPYTQEERLFRLPRLDLELSALKLD